MIYLVYRCELNNNTKWKAAVWFNNFSTGKNAQVRTKINKPYLLFWLYKILRKIFSYTAVVKLPIKYIKFARGHELFTVASDTRRKKK